MVRNISSFICAVLVLCIITACGDKAVPKKAVLENVLEVMDPEMDKLFYNSAALEILGDGFEWAEGPVWVPEHEMLLFTDPPENKIYRWKKDEGVKLYLDKAGYLGSERESDNLGANGLALDKYGALILCQHGERKISRMAAPILEPSANFLPLIYQYAKHSFNSPNDLCIDKAGKIYFTDPPYGLPNLDQDSLKQLPYSGVFVIETNGTVDLIDTKITRPNGITLSPNEDKLFVANSDEDNPGWYVYDILEDGKIKNKQIFYQADKPDDNNKGLPDGMKMHPGGFLFASGPGGIWIFNINTQKVIGKIRTPQATANCAFDDKYEYLYLTSDDTLYRISLKAGWEQLK